MKHYRTYIKYHFKGIYAHYKLALLVPPTTQKSDENSNFFIKIARVELFSKLRLENEDTVCRHGLGCLDCLEITSQAYLVPLISR